MQILAFAVLLCSYAVPSPTVALTVLSSEPQHVAGGTFSAQCQATVSHHVNTPVTVDFTWGRTSGLITSSSSPRIAISDTTSDTNLTSMSTLTITELSIGAESQMNYSCEAVVRSDPYSPNILTSTPAESNIYFLYVHGMFYS
jgi:hypothetical protein